MDSSQGVEISVVIPVFNGEENLPVLIPRVVEVFDQLSKVYEVICVDGGSADGSGKILRKIAIQHPVLRGLGLRENRGLTTALLARGMFMLVSSLKNHTRLSGLSLMGTFIIAQILSCDRADQEQGSPCRHSLRSRMGFPDCGGRRPQRPKEVHWK